MRHLPLWPLIFFLACLVASVSGFVLFFISRWRKRFYPGRQGGALFLIWKLGLVCLLVAIFTTLWVVSNLPDKFEGLIFPSGNKCCELTALKDVDPDFWSTTVLAAQQLQIVEAQISTQLPLGSISGVVNEIAGDAVESYSRSHQREVSENYENCESVGWSMPISAPIFGKGLFAMGVVLALWSAWFLTGRHQRPEIGLPMHIGGLIIMLLSGYFLAS
jgi:hypothetical protein